ncbi:right-handed parallel beta-helix repeat-containing protein [Methanococcoides orientis]|uniref:right-handed parallel beta-helix repeat-containing protein n=1 Tax=Methanococcoides orientis TaxID=2822137 RepID=UPI001E4295B0|nr:NosD domain-containing protein [Methanococcoides orientis]UGV41780.1 right-handed parallel beta-helix repeat-containing protein [Methanococcoides orientis]
MTIKQSILICFEIALVLMTAGTAAATDIDVYPGDSIQAAVNAANNNDTIIVHTGNSISDSIYVEHVVVNKELTIKSSSHAVVLADATNVNVFEVTANNVTINGFCVLGTTTASGIFLDGVEGCTVTNNVLLNNEYGIALFESDYNNLTSNTASNNDYGIRLDDSSDYNDLVSNTASNNSNRGIYLYNYSNNNGLIENTVSYNKFYGIDLHFNSNYNNLTSNTVSKNRIGIALDESSYNNLISNNASFNNNDGIKVVMSKDTKLISNTVSNNVGDGIYLYMDSHNTKLISNTVSNNNDSGIYLRMSSSNKLISNTVSNNDDGGIYLDESNRNLIYNNHFNNTENTFSIDSTRNIWNATKTPETNIIGGPFIGGNYWATPEGKGFSQNHTDTNGDWFCDSLLSEYIFDGNTDYLPLTYPSNQPPVADVNGPYGPVDEGSPITLDASGSSDPEGDELTYEWDFDYDGINFDVDATGETPTNTWYDNATYTIVVRVSDGMHTDINETTVTVNNVAPTATAVGEVINENDSTTVSGTITDLGTNDTFDVMIDWGDGDNNTYSYPAGSTGFSETHQYPDDDPTGTLSDDYTVNVTVTDDDGGESTASATVTVNNVAPNILSYTVQPTGSIEVGIDVVYFNATFTDQGSQDTHSWEIDWGDNVTSDAVTGLTVNESHIYGEAGMHTVILTVTDDDGGFDTIDHQYVVVYDPASGSVAGKGSFDSLAGAYGADSNLAGVATFDFNSEYKKGVLTGETQFEFEDLNFHSVDYEWMVVAGHKATYKGNGTVNGEVDYEFLISAIDDDDDYDDMFRIKIWNTTTVIYDNNVGIGTGDYADPITEIETGIIQIKP